MMMMMMMMMMMIIIIIKVWANTIHSFLFSFATKIKIIGSTCAISQARGSW